MVDKKHLRGKTVAFRIIGSNRVNSGIVQGIEEDGFWIESVNLLKELEHDVAWQATVAEVTQPPLFFVPTSSLMFLMAPKF